MLEEIKWAVREVDSQEVFGYFKSDLDAEIFRLALEIHDVGSGYIEMEVVEAENDHA